MRRLILLSLFPCLVWANDESLHSLNLSHSQFTETLSLGGNDYELSPNGFALAYTYISPSDWIWSGSLWKEDAKETFARGAKIEKQAWGAGLSFIYPMNEFDLELNYAYSQPELDARGPGGNSLEERNESMEYGIGVSSYFEHYQWSLSPSIELAYQDSKAQDRIRINNTSLLSESNETGWLISSALNLSYLYELSAQASLNPFIGVSWKDFLDGKGLTRTTALRRNISLSSTEESKLDADGSGLISIGIGFSCDRYHLDLSVDETIDFPTVGTQVNIGLGMVW